MKIFEKEICQYLEIVIFFNYNDFGWCLKICLIFYSAFQHKCNSIMMCLKEIPWRQQIRLIDIQYWEKCHLAPFVEQQSAGVRRGISDSSVSVSNYLQLYNVFF